MNKINIAEVEVGDVFSEESRFYVVAKNPTNVVMKHLESGNEITLTNGYVTELLKTADSYEKEVVVGKENKLWTKKQIEEAISKKELPSDTKVREGDVRVKGIRTIWEEITGGQVFTVCFQKQGKDLSTKAYNEKVDLITTQAVENILKAKTNKKSISQTAIDIIKNIIQNPILTHEPGEFRTLRGYKIEFFSRDGKYNCIDMDIQGSYESKIRPVNINTISFLVYDGIKYSIEK